MSASTRRSFFKSAVATGAALSLPALQYSRVYGANSRLGIASVGTGGKGWSDLLGVAASPQVQVIGLCNIDSSAEHLGQAAEKYPVDRESFAVVGVTPLWTRAPSLSVTVTVAPEGLLFSVTSLGRDPPKMVAQLVRSIDERIIDASGMVVFAGFIWFLGGNRTNVYQPGGSGRSSDASGKVRVAALRSMAKEVVDWRGGGGFCGRRFTGAGHRAPG